MNPDELQKELDGLWSRVTSGMPGAPASPVFGPPIPSDAPSITSEATAETMAWMKRQHRAQLEEFRRLLETKDATLSDLRARHAAAEQELAGLRRKSQREDAVVYQQTLEMAARLEQAQKGLKAQDERFRLEESSLRALAEQANARLAAEAGRWRELERQWSEREQQYLLDLQELRSAAERASRCAGTESAAGRKAVEDLKAAKGAVEKTLAQLLQERHDRETAEKEREAAIAKVREAEDRLNQMQNLWQEERKQWQELWDRERSTWEAQRQEFSSWEEKLRKERETWHAQMQDAEGRETQYATQMAEALRKSSEAGERVAGLLRSAAERPAAAPPAPPPPAASAVTRVAPSRPWRPVLAGLAAVLLGAALVPAVRWWGRLVVTPISSVALPVASPTGMSYDGSLLWVCDWAGEFTLLDPADPARGLERMRAAPAGTYHPVALALSGDGLYSIDSAQSRVVRHAIGRPSDVRVVWPTPGPAPTAVAHDGKNLWSYDAVTRVFYRHLGEGGDAAAEQYRADPELVPGAMAWQGGELWVYDAKGRRLVVLKTEGHELKLVKSAPLAAPLQGLSLMLSSGEGGRRQLELWGLSPAAPGQAAATLRRFVIRR
ncbi:MAG: hypothetical protein WC969_12450 [Elusimicrobiota bacterium]|jgi:hypothetical protein